MNQKSDTQLDCNSTHYELNQKDIDQLKEKLLLKVTDGKFELLPYYGFLVFKDKMWEGRVLKIVNNEVGNNNDVDEDDFSVFFLELGLKICPEMQDFAMKEIVNIDTTVTVFDLKGGEDKERASKQNNRLCQETFRYIKEMDTATDAGNRRRHYAESTRGEFEMNDAEEIIGCRIKRDHISCCLLAVLKDPTSDKFTSAVIQVSGYEVRTMSVDETLYAIKHWKYADEMSMVRYAASANMKLAIGAFPLGSSSPVAWAMISLDGAIAALQTLPAHRGKGLGKAVVKSISLVALQRSLIPYVFIEDIDTAYIPVSLFSGLGFQVFDKYHFDWTRLSKI
eukprot:gene10120-11154_t